MDGVVGIDEVGRGCWAGPLVAGAVVLAAPITGLADSKQLSPAQRDRLAATIRVEAAAFGLGWVTPAEVDRLGLTKAVALAMRRALAQITIVYSQIIIDGSYNFLPRNKLAKAITKADATVPPVSAASILAKVARDKYMNEISQVYPNYQFHKHVGYGTQLHQAMLQKYGPCQLHRRSYKPIQAWLGAQA